jgi:AraC family transcriptional regulator
MVCPRCISAVENTLKEMQIEPISVSLGEVRVAKELTEKEQVVLANKLAGLGFELLDDSKKQLILKIKSIIIDHIHHQEHAKFVFSEVLASELNKEYSALSKLFSATEGITIEQFIILQKIEKVKELLIYNEMNLSEIANKMGYSSVAHLSSQFKKIIGLTPSAFKQQDKSMRKPLNEL